MTPLHQAWDALRASPLFGLLGTLLAYEVAVVVQRRVHENVLANPVLLASAMLVLLLEVSGVSYESYMAGAGLVFVLLGPATVALSVPLYGHALQVRRSAVRLCVAAGAGAAVAAISAVGIAAALGAPDMVLRSIAPKSVTTAIAIGLSEQIGGQPGLTAALVVTTGIIGAVISGRLLDVAGVRSARLRGLAIGVSGHGIGTAYALTESPEAGAYAGAGMAFAGVLTGLLLPTIWSWIMHN